MRYTPSETLRNLWAFVLTRVFYPGARLIRRPFICRGRRHLAYGEGLTTGYHCRFDLNSDVGAGSGVHLSLGKNCKLGDWVHIVASRQVIIGDDCLMASHVFISDTDHGDLARPTPHATPQTAPDRRPLVIKPVRIGDRVWIGEKVSILPGVQIGSGSILGAHSLVNRDVPENTIVAGVPAVVIKVWDEAAGRWVRPRDAGQA